MMSRTGVDVTADQAALLFNKDTEKAYQTIIDQEVDSIDQKKLIGYLCKQSWENTRRAQRSGKKTIRYCSIVIKFATFARSKMGNARHAN